jgi:ribosome-associated protein
MDIPTSRTEKKRQAKAIEKLVQELVGLSPATIDKLPCDDFLKQDIKDAGSMKAGARKRQIKYIAKELRAADPEPLMTFLEEIKGSQLKKNHDFHELEQLRDAIISEVLETYKKAQATQEELPGNWQSEIAFKAAESFPSLDTKAVARAAQRFARGRKPVYSREIFRLLKAAQERQRFSQDNKKE